MNAPPSAPVKKVNDLGGKWHQVALQQHIATAVQDGLKDGKYALDQNGIVRIAAGKSATLENATDLKYTGWVDENTKMITHLMCKDVVRDALYTVEQRN